MKDINRPIVIDNFLSSDEFDEVKNLVIGNKDFPWYHQPFVSAEESNDGQYYTHLLYHGYKPNSPWFDSFQKLFIKIDAKALSRVKVNYYPTTKKVIKHGMHVDEPFKHHGAIFYLNTNNGKTIISDDIEIDSIENRLLLFDPSVPHQSTTCSDHKWGRYNINMNFFGSSLIDEYC